MLKRLIFIVLIGCFSATIAQDSIRKADIHAALRLIDLKYTEAEVDSMFQSVRTNLSYIKLQHQSKLSNDVPLAFIHSPLLPNMQPLSPNKRAIQWKAPVSKLPINKEELAFYSVAELSYLIKNKIISSEELTKFFISRIKKWGDTLQCVVSITEELAIQEAKAADAEIKAGKYRGPLHGIPYGLKDLFAVKGTKTTWGAAPYKDQVIDQDAFVYQQLKKSGAVLVAKFTLGALAMGDVWFGGRTNNPWNMTYGSSGSSAGSASATVAGLVPFAIGTETWGSIISPSSTCGATGLRPTFGTVSRSGGMTLCWSLDKVGPITRNAMDAAIVYEAIIGKDANDRSTVAAGFDFNPQYDIKKMKIAYAKNYFDRIRDTTRSEWKVLAEFKKMGVELIPVVFPDSGVYKPGMMDLVLTAECAATFDEFTRLNVDDMMTAQKRGDWPNIFRTARLLPATSYINANRQRYQLMEKVNQLTEQYDVIICPTRGSGNQSAITNLTGHPAICVPTGFDSKTNLPSSITFIGKLYGEGAIVAAADAYQKKTQWHQQHPEKFKQ